MTTTCGRRAGRRAGATPTSCPTSSEPRASRFPPVLQASRTSRHRTKTCILFALTFRLSRSPTTCGQHGLVRFLTDAHAKVPDPDQHYHGYEGPMKVTYPDAVPDLTNATLEAAMEMGQKLVDVNGRDQEGEHLQSKALSCALHGLSS